MCACVRFTTVACVVLACTRQPHAVLTEAKLEAECNTFIRACTQDRDREVQAMQWCNRGSIDDNGVAFLVFSPSTALLVVMPPLLHVCTKATTHLSSQVLLVWQFGGTCHSKNLTLHRPCFCSSDVQVTRLLTM
ncbi:hypothetical protein VPH35_104271 [Triticum aestivum]